MNLAASHARAAAIWNRWRSLVALLTLGLGLGPCLAGSIFDNNASSGEPPRKAIDFNFQVRPILSDKCFNCHGPDSRQRKAGLRLDTRDGAFGTTKSGSRAIVPGDLDESELIARITSDDEGERMPPKSLGRPLSAAEIETLKEWVAQGADWKPHWSFLPPRVAPVPAVKNSSWPRNRLDSYVLARLDSRGLRPAPEASKERLIRRVTFDLTGLPPTLAEIDAFLDDSSPRAYDRLVDRLLASPRFGERMAVEWLDLRAMPILTATRPTFTVPCGPGATGWCGP